MNIHSWPIFYLSLYWGTSIKINLRKFTRYLHNNDRCFLYIYKYLQYFQVSIVPGPFFSIPFFFWRFWSTLNPLFSWTRRSIFLVVFLFRSIGHYSIVILDHLSSLCRIICPKHKEKQRGCPLLGIYIWYMRVCLFASSRGPLCSSKQLCYSR